MMITGESGFLGGGSSDLDESECFIEASFMYDVDVTAVEDDAKEDSSDDDRSSEELDRSGRYLLITRAACNQQHELGIPWGTDDLGRKSRSSDRLGKKTRAIARCGSILLTIDHIPWNAHEKLRM